MATKEEKGSQKREELLGEILGAVDDLRNSIDDLLSSVDDALAEAEDKETDTERLEEILHAIRSVADNQEQDLGI